jgi:hypothetical protein
MSQVLFNPVDFGGFAWTEDWYRWDAAAGHEAARAARDARAGELRRAGHRVRCFALRHQVVSKGGVGSGRPHVEFVVTVYGIITGPDGGSRRA